MTVNELIDALQRTSCKGDEVWITDTHGNTLLITGVTPMMPGAVLLESAP